MLVQRFGDAGQPAQSDCWRQPEVRGPAGRRSQRSQKPRSITGSGQWHGLPILQLGNRFFNQQADVKNPTGMKLTTSLPQKWNQWFFPI